MGSYYTSSTLLFAFGSETIIVKFIALQVGGVWMIILASRILNLFDVIRSSIPASRDKLRILRAINPILQVWSWKIFNIWCLQSFTISLIEGQHSARPLNLRDQVLNNTIIEY